MNFFNKFIQGIVIGAAAIAPGVSGGSLAVIFGIYDKLTNFIGNITKNFKENIVFFFPFLFGAGIGVLAFSRIIDYLFINHEVLVRYAFVGFMIGTFPFVFKQANKKGYKNSYLVPFFITLILSLAVIYVENRFIENVTKETMTLVEVIFYGSIIGFGTVVPGISASVVLMYMGSYQQILKAVTHFKIDVILYLGFGFVLSIILFSKLISKLFARFYGITYYAILGLVIGSTASIFPGFKLTASYLFYLGVLLISGMISYYLGKVTM